MKDKATIFDGKDLHTIGVKYFFQHPIITDLTKEEVLYIYQQTMLFNYTTEQDEEAKAKIEKGSDILEHMVLDMYGDKEGQPNIDRVKFMII